MGERKAWWTHRIRAEEKQHPTTSRSVWVLIRMEEMRESQTAAGVLSRSEKLEKRVGDACLAVWSRSARIMYIVVIKLTSKELKGCKLALV